MDLFFPHKSAQKNDNFHDSIITSAVLFPGAVVKEGYAF